MRFTLACLLVAALGRSAIADAQLTSLIKGYEREASGCQKSARGVRVVIERGRPVSGTDQELANDLTELAKVQATVQSHCDELEATLEFLRADPSATFKKLQKEIDERAKKVRIGRAASRQALADAEQRITRSVPRINKLMAQADADARPSLREQKAAAEKAAANDKAATDKAATDKAAADKAAADKAAADKAAADKAAAKKVETTVTAPKPAEAKPLSTFPSGRAIQLSAPAEAWTLSGTADADVAEYAFAGTKATLFVRRHAGAPSCEQIRTAMTLAGGRAQAQTVAASAELKQLKPTWIVTWSEADTQVRVVCVAANGGVVVARTEATLAGNAPLDTVLARMIAVNVKR